MDQYRKMFKNNATVITLIILVVMAGFFALSVYGLPYFTESPDTYEVQEVADFTETEDSLIVTVENEKAREQLDVVADNTQIQWNKNGSAVVNRSKYNNVVIESYSNGEIYEEYEYEYNTLSYEITGINESEAVLTNKNYKLRTVTSGGPVADATWTVNGEVVQESHSVISYRFDDPNKTYTVKSSSNIDGSTYQASLEITPVEPDDVVINTTATKTNVKTYEEITFNTFERTNQSVQFVKYDYDNGDTEVSNISNNTLHWYTEPGEYQVKVEGESTITGNTGVDTVNITVKNRTETLNKRVVTVNVYDSSITNATEPGVDASISEINVSVNDGLVLKQTGIEGRVEFNLPNERNYTIKAGIDSNEFATETKEIYLDEDNRLIDFRLSEPTLNDSISDINNTRELADDQIGLGLNESDINGTNNTTEPDPDGLDAVIESLEGEGTSNNPYIIDRVVELQAIQTQPSAVYSIASNIDASQTRGWNSIKNVDNEAIGTANKSNFQLKRVDTLSRIAEGSVVLYLNDEEIDKSEYTVNYNTGEIRFLSGSPSDATAVSDSAIIKADYNPQSYYQGFKPIDSGGANTEIRGNGNTISSIYINRPQQNNVGIIKNISNGAVSNLNIVDSEITGKNNVGAILGRAQQSEIESVKLKSVEVIGNKNVGGIIGQGSSVNIFKSRLGTRNLNEINGVNGNNNVGGVIGYATSDSEISQVSTDSRTYIFGNAKVGGIVGQYRNGEISDVSSRARIRNTSKDTGGIAGRISDSDILRSYTTADINSTGDEIDRIGTVSGFSDSNYDSVYWNTDINTNISRPIGNRFGEITGISSLTTDQMKISSPDTFEDFDFDNIWSDNDGSYPKLIETSLNEERHNVTIRTIDVTNNEPISGTVELESYGLKSGQEVTYTGVRPGEYEVTINSPSYAPDTRDIDVQSDIDEQVRLRSSADIDAEIIVSDSTGSLIGSPGPSFEAKIGDRTGSSNPSVFESIGEDTYSISVNNVDGYVDESVDNQPVTKYSPHIIELGINNVATSSYEVEYVESESDISDKSTRLTGELESEVVDDNIESPNPTLRFKQGQRYSIDISETPSSESFRIVDEGGNVLLKAGDVAENGEYYDDPDVNVNKTEDGRIKFNVTEELLGDMARYKHKSYSSMSSDIVEVAEADKASLSIHEFRLNKSVDINVITNPTIENAEIYLRKGGERVATSPDGEFINVKKGEYAITVEAPGYETNSINKEISDGETYEINMNPSGSDLIDVNVNIDDTTLVSGKSIDSDNIKLETPEGSVLSKNVQSGKTQYEFKSVAEGEIDITYNSEEYLRNTHSADTSGMDEFTHEFSLEPMATFEVDVNVDDAGSTVPLEAHGVRVINTSNSNSKIVPINITDNSGDLNGESTISVGRNVQLPDGSYDVQVNPIGYYEKTVTRPNPATDTVSVDFTSQKRDVVDILLGEDTGTADKIEVKNVNTDESSRLSDSDVYNSPTADSEGEVLLYQGIKYNFELVDSGGSFSNQFGAPAKIVDSTGYTLISSDFSRPAGLHKNDPTWDPSLTTKNGNWSYKQVETGVKVKEKNIKFTPTSLYSDVAGLKVEDQVQFDISYEGGVPAP